MENIHLPLILLLLCDILYNDGYTCQYCGILGCLDVAEIEVAVIESIGTNYFLDICRVFYADRTLLIIIGGSMLGNWED